MNLLSFHYQDKKKTAEKRPLPWPALLGICILGIFLISLLFTFILIPSLEIHGGSPWPEASVWMSELDDSVTLTEIAIPGTHDSAAMYARMAYFSKCQWDSIRTQLEEGYRFLDFRLGAVEKKEGLVLRAMHGDMPCRTMLDVFSPDLRAEELFKQCTDFLAKHPSETILISVKQEGSSLSIEEFEQMLRSLIDTAPEYWLLTKQIPTLGEARGKIVLLERIPEDEGIENRLGINMYWPDQAGAAHEEIEGAEYTERNGYPLAVQDHYEYHSKDKWDSFEKALEAPVPGALNINFLSTKGEAAIGHPYSFARQLNIKLAQKDLSEVPTNQWILVDFAEEAAAQHIYAMNLGTDAVLGDPEAAAHRSGFDIYFLMVKYFSENFVFLGVLIIGLTVLHQHSVVGQNRVNSIIRTMVIALILSIVDFMELRLSVGTDHSYWRIVFSVIGYTLRPAAVVSLFDMVWKNKKLYIVSYSLLVVNFFIHLTAFWTNVAFTFTQENGFSRGPLGYTSHILSIAFIVIIIVGAVRFVKQNDARETIVVFLTAIFCTLAAILMTLGIVQDVLNTTIVISCIFYYLYLHMQVTSRDMGTGLRNRQRFYDDSQKYDNSISAIIMLDMNGLKHLNDTYGHAAGDQGLQTLADCFTSCAGRSDYVYRVGGDEFLILCCGKSEPEVSALVEKIRKETAKTPYSCSIGYAMREDGMDMTTLGKAADMQMYKNKSQYYRESGRDRRNR